MLLLACSGALRAALLQTEKSEQQFSVFFELQNPKNLGSTSSVDTSSPRTAVPAEIHLSSLPGARACSNLPAELHMEVLPNIFSSKWVRLAEVVENVFADLAHSP